MTLFPKDRLYTDYSTFYSTSEVMSEQTENLPAALYSANQVRELDQRAIELFGTPGLELMTRAGRFCFHRILKQNPGVEKLIILCGGGNNAGDGYIIAGLALKRGLTVDLWHVKPPESLKGDAKSAYEYALKEGASPKAFDAREWKREYDASRQTNSLRNSVIVDALLGTGLSSDLRGDFETAVDCANRLGIWCMAVDIPTGINSDTGGIMGKAIKANACTNFIGLKVGCFTNEGREYSGLIEFTDLEVDPRSYDTIEPVAKKLALPTILSKLPRRNRNAHKGHNGHVLVIGGELGFGGAISLAAQSAARMGAGLVSVISKPEHVSPILSSQPEIMVHGFSNIESNKEAIDHLMGACSVIVIGPGLGQSEWSSALFSLALKKNKPMLVDADGLNLLSKLNSKEPLPDTLLLTPHPGEAARLLGSNTQEIQSDRIASVGALSKKYQASVLLKGSGSLITEPEENVFLCPYGNPGMASGGMGDVLSGIIGGLLAQGLEPLYAMQLGVCLHSAAADELAKTKGERGLLAGDLINEARRLLNGMTN